MNNVYSKSESYSNEKKNINIISTFNSELNDTGSQHSNNHNTNSHPINNQKNNNNNKNEIKNLRSDVVDIAESISNLIKMLNEQRERMQNLETTINTKLTQFENRIAQIECNIDAKIDIKMNNSKIFRDLEQKQMGITRIAKNNKLASSCESKTDSEAEAETETIAETDTMMENKSVREVKSNQDKKLPPEIKSKSSRTSRSIASRTETHITESCASECEKNYNKLNNKNIEEKLNNISRQFNTELMNMKRKQASLAMAYFKIRR